MKTLLFPRTLVGLLMAWFLILAVVNALPQETTQEEIIEESDVAESKNTTTTTASSGPVSIPFDYPELSEDMLSKLSEPTKNLVGVTNGILHFVIENALGGLLNLVPVPSQLKQMTVQSLLKLKRNIIIRSGVELDNEVKQLQAKCIAELRTPTKEEMEALTNTMKQQVAKIAKQELAAWYVSDLQPIIATVSNLLGPATIQKVQQLKKELAEKFNQLPKSMKDLDPESQEFLNDMLYGTWNGLEKRGFFDGFGRNPVKLIANFITSTIRVNLAEKLDSGRFEKESTKIFKHIEEAVKKAKKAKPQRQKSRRV